MMAKKLFTLEEANRRLPLIKRIVEDILKKGQKLKGLAMFEKTPSVEQGYAATLAEIEQLTHELENLGCYFKDWNFEVGLVDFPALIGGQEVLFCWRSDEPAIEWYHNEEDGYAGRQPIPEDLGKSSL